MSVIATNNFTAAAAADAAATMGATYYQPSKASRWRTFGSKSCSSRGTGTLSGAYSAAASSRSSLATRVYPLWLRFLGILAAARQLLQDTRSNTRDEHPRALTGAWVGVEQQSVSRSLLVLP